MQGTGFVGDKKAKQKLDATQRLAKEPREDMMLLGTGGEEHLAEDGTKACQPGVS